MSFTLYEACGGHIVEFRFYDSINDRENRTLHIIRTDEEFGERLAQIITFESLQHG